MIGAMGGEGEYPLLLTSIPLDLEGCLIYQTRVSWGGESISVASLVIGAMSYV